MLKMCRSGIFSCCSPSKDCDAEARNACINSLSALEAAMPACVLKYMSRKEKAGPMRLASQVSIATTISMTLALYVASAAAAAGVYSA